MSELSPASLKARGPVWTAFLTLIPSGWEPLDGEDFERLAESLAASGYSRGELWWIFWDEVSPAWGRDWPEGYSWSTLHPLCQEAAECPRLWRWGRRGGQLLCALLLLAILPLTLFSALILWRWWEVVRDADRVIEGACELRSRQAIGA